MNSHDNDIETTSINPIKQSAQSATKASARKQSAVKTTNESLLSSKKIAQPSQIKETDQTPVSAKRSHSSMRSASATKATSAMKAIQQSDEITQEEQSAQEHNVTQPSSEEPKLSSAVKQTNVENNFEPASYVKKVYDEEVKSIPASSQKINKTQRPDKSVLIAYQSLIYPPIEVTRPVFESYKQSNSELLFTDPITGYPFIILRDKKANSVCRVFATGDALTMQQNSFGLKNLYESRYLMRNFIRDISTIRTLSSTLSASAQKLN
jgi:hypothetical protein